LQLQNGNPLLRAKHDQDIMTRIKYVFIMAKNKQEIYTLSNFLRWHSLVLQLSEQDEQRKLFALINRTLSPAASLVLPQSKYATLIATLSSV